jgi:glycosyltransferase involved in cell wall biosynthesis
MLDPLRVSHVLLSLDVGGLEHVVLDLVREGQKLGQEVSVMCLERPGTLARQAGALGVEVRCLYKPAGLKLGTILRLREPLRELRPTVVHTHQIGALFYAGPAAHAAGIPLVVHTEHGKHYATRRRTRWLGWLAGHCAAHFFCVSRDIGAEVRAHRIVARSKVSMVANGIDTARFRGRGEVDPLRAALGIPRGAPVVGTVGRLSEVKRQDLLLRALAQVRQQLPGVHLLLVGDGPMAGPLRNLTGALQLEGCVHFAGYQSEPARYFPLMDVFALTSSSEGTPLVVLEAFAAGLPVVASRVGGLPEIIDEGRTGLLFPSGDANALACSLAELLQDPARAGRLARAAQQEAEARYDVRIMARNYHDHYLKLLGRENEVLACAS